MVDLVGGYYSTGFAILVLGSLIAGSILNALHNTILRAMGIGIFLYGGVLLVGLLAFVINTTPNLPEYAGVFPILFVVILLLVAFKMISKPPFKKKGGLASVASSKEETK